MKLSFTKMHGAGNDFIVIDAISQPLSLTDDQWRYLADRRFGIGADQILVVEAPPDESVDFRYRIFNADGGEVEQCGNGARAFVRYVTDKKLTSKRAIRVLTMSGVIAPSLQDNGLVTVDMGAPRTQPDHIPFIDTGLTSRREADADVWPLPVGDTLRDMVMVSMGNPHAVQIVDRAENAPVESEGPLIEHHARFPQRVNAGFLEIIDPSHVVLRVFERGAGETLACGTGACAAVVSGILRGKLTSPVEVSTRGGMLQVSWSGHGEPVFLTGDAVTVFEGTIELPD